MAKNENVTLRGVQVRFKNFSGREEKFNPAGKRNFCVFLDPNTAAQLKQAGWNVKQLKPKDPGDPPQDYIQVSIMFGKYPPSVLMSVNGQETEMSEMNVGTLDDLEIESADVMMRPYHWEFQGRKGIKAFVQKARFYVKQPEMVQSGEDILGPSAEPFIEEEIPF